jgi:hypothetical protein
MISIRYAKRFEPSVQYINVYKGFFGNFYSAGTYASDRHLKAEICFMKCVTCLDWLVSMTRTPRCEINNTSEKMPVT